MNDRSCGPGPRPRAAAVVAGVLALLGCGRPARRRASADDGAVGPGAPARGGRPGRLALGARSLAAGTRRAAAAQLCPLARARSRARTGRPSRPTPPSCAAGPTGPASARCRRAPRRRWTRPCRSSERLAFFADRAPRTRQGRILYAEALIAAGRRAEAVARAAREPGSRTISARPRSGCSSTASAADLSAATTRRGWTGCCGTAGPTRRAACCRGSAPTRAGQARGAAEAAAVRSRRRGRAGRAAGRGAARRRA